jgi:hypothetical protein
MESALKVIALSVEVPAADRTREQADQLHINVNLGSDQRLGRGLEPRFHETVMPVKPI